MSLATHIHSGEIFMAKIANSKKMPVSSSVVGTGSPPSNGAQQSVGHYTYTLPIRFNNGQQLAHSYITGQQHKSLAVLSAPTAVNSAISAVSQPTGKHGTSAVRNAVAPISSIFSKDNRPKANIHESTYNILLGAAKVYLKTVKKAEVLLQLLQSDPQLGLTWGVLGRCPYLESRLTYKLKVNRHYARNFSHGAWRKLQPSIKLPKFSVNILAGLIQQASNSYKCSGTSASKSFAKRLLVLSSDSTALALLLINMGTPSWRELKQLALVYGKQYFSAVRYVYIQALLLTNNTALSLLGVTPNMLVSKPFSGNWFQLPKIQLRMGSKYVVKRAGNAKMLTQLALQQGQIEFVFPVKRSTSIVGTVVFHQAILNRLKQGHQIEVFNIWSSHGPSKQVKVNVVLKGSTHIATTQVHKYLSQLQLPSTPVLGLDVNGLGKHMLAYNNSARQPSSIQTLIRKFKAYEQTISALSRKQSRVKNRTRKYKLGKQIALVHDAKKRKLGVIHTQATFFTAAVLIASRSHTLAIEDLNVSARNTRGALAKAILSMPDGQALYDKACLIATHITGKRVEIQAVNPAYTSLIHNSCGGRLKRVKGGYHTAPCAKCNKMVNTHLNAAHNIVAKAHTSSAKKSVQTAAKIT